MKINRLVLFYFFVFGSLYFIGCVDQNLNSHKQSENSFEKSKDYSLEELSPKEYAHWVKRANSPIRKEKKIGDFSFSVLYKPLEYIVCMEERTPNLTDSILAKRIDEIGDMEYYDLKIELKNGTTEPLKYDLKSAQQYTDRVNYFAFGMQKDIHLVVDGKDTIACGLYHFERAYDAVPFVKLLLGFKRTSRFKEKTLVLHDKTFDNGIVKFHYKKHEFENVPKLKTI